MFIQFMANLGDIFIGVSLFRPNRCEGTVLIAVFTDDDEAFLFGVIGIVGVVIRDDQTIYQDLGGSVEGMIVMELMQVGGGLDGQHGAFSG